MKKKQLESIFESFLNKVYSFSNAIAPNKDMAKELLLDAYTNLILKDREMIETESLKDSEDRIFFRDYFFMRTLSEIVLLAQKKQKVYQISKIEGEYIYRDFYRLDIKQRACLFLTQHFLFTTEQVCEVLNLKRTHVVELLYFAKTELLKQSKGKGNERSL